MSVIGSRHLIRTRDMLGLRWLRGLRKRTIGRTRRTVALGAPAVIVGSLAAAGGISNGARLMLADLAQRGVRFHAVDVTRQLGMAAVMPEGAGPGNELPLLPRIVHLNPPHFGRALRRLGQAAFAGPVVGYWAWELETAPREWIASAQLADEIWVPSPFVRDALLNVLRQLDDAPALRVVPHAVEAGPIIPRDALIRSTARHQLALPPDGFVAGFTFSMLAGVRRKNPEAAISAFRAAFPAGSKDSTLLLRCVDPGKNQSACATLRRLAAEDSRIRLVESATCRIQDFFAAIDVLLSLHRSEGYGLILAEALRAEIPVIATSWSISDEISRNPLFYPVPSTLIPVHDPSGPYRNFSNQRWAEPDLAAAIQHLQQLQAIHGYHIANGQA